MKKTKYYLLERITPNKVDDASQLRLGITTWHDEHSISIHLMAEDAYKYGGGAIWIGKLSELPSEYKILNDDYDYQPPSYEQIIREQIAKEIEAMKFQPNPNHDRHEALIAKTYWEEAKLEAERIARGQK